MNPGVDRECSLLEEAPTLFRPHPTNSVLNPQDFMLTHFIAFSFN